jgi:hypothetical protein
MAIQIFPEQFYTKMCNRERIGVTLNETFEILPPESFCSRLKRFLTFQQDPHIDKVHNLFKALVERAEQAKGPHILTEEIHRHGLTKYKYLEANLICLRKKLDNIGQLNWFSKLILKVINAVCTLFGRAPIQLKNYARHSYEVDHDIPWAGTYHRVDSSFDFHGSSGDYINPLGKEGLKLTPTDENTCVFSSDSQRIKEEVQKLEKGLKDYYYIDQTYKTYNLPGTTQILANLEISFDPEQQRFSAAINNARAGFYLVRDSQVFIKHRDLCEEISPVFAKYLSELHNDAKTFRYFVTATNAKKIVTQHELTWIVQATEQAPFQLNQGSLPLILEPGTQYQFYDENHQQVGSFKITLNKI